MYYYVRIKLLRKNQVLLYIKIVNIKRRINMWPLGQYERMVDEIKRRENPYIPITFGLLIADYRQQKCREYILNYIERFDYKSDRYINFYLPGYLTERFENEKNKIKIKDRNYYFDENIYLDFLNHLEDDFEIDYPYNPVLILVEYDKGHFKNTHKIIIELDSNGSEIEQTGMLFEKIFSIAKSKVTIKEFSNDLIKDKIKLDLISIIIDCIGNRYLSAIYSENNLVKKYRIKKCIS